MSERTFHITTHGCQMNAHDSGWLRRALLALGFAETARAEARVHILNTCSVRNKPENKVYSELGRIHVLAREFPNRDIIACVGGCVAQQVGDKLFSRSKELRLVFGADGITNAPEAIALLAEDSSKKLSLLDFSPEYAERELKTEPDAPLPSAFVSIMQGCDNFCAYCIVPFTRGRQKSRKTEAILDECRRVVHYGAKEITLLGQNVNSFGQDAQGSGISFSELLYKVAALPGLERLRFITPHPKDLAPELIKAFAELPKLAPRLHLPLQSGSDRILKAMNRKYTRETYLDTVYRLREARPGIQFSTDIIVGFPGETEGDFADTMRLMGEANFAASFSFVYSDRPGTRAALLKNKIPRKESLVRLGILQDWQKKNTKCMLESMLGKETVVLIEGKSQMAEMPDRPGCRAANFQAERYTSWHGRDEYGISVNIPVQASRRINAGDMPRVKIVGCSEHTLKGELLQGVLTL